MKKQKKKPCYEISYIKLTYNSNGSIQFTIKVSKVKSDR